MLECPKCKTNEHTNPSLEMLINECGHPLCRNCVENIFIRNQGQCPHEGCGRMLKKSSYWEQLFDDPRIERELFIRRRLSKVYNLHEDDFPTLRAFNDYLEHLEEIIQKLVSNDDDLEEIEAEIRDFRELNTNLIEKNKRRPTQDDIWVQHMLDEEANRARRLEDATGEEENTDAALQFDPKTIIKELRDSDLPAEIVLNQKRKQQIEAEMLQRERAEQKKREKLLERNQRDQTLYGPIRVSGRPYQHKEPTVRELNGPPMPDQRIINERYAQYIVIAPFAVAGGFTQPLGCQRMLIEARMDLFS